MYLKKYIFYIKAGWCHFDKCTVTVDTEEMLLGTSLRVHDQMFVYHKFIYIGNYWQIELPKELY